MARKKKGWKKKVCVQILRETVVGALLASACHKEASHCEKCCPENEDACNGNAAQKFSNRWINDFYQTPTFFPIFSNLFVKILRPFTARFGCLDYYVAKEKKIIIPSFL
jgi:hypothetical protein